MPEYKRMYTSERLVCVWLTFSEGVTSVVPQPHLICGAAEEDAVAAEGTSSQQRAHRVLKIHSHLTIISRDLKIKYASIPNKNGITFKNFLASRQ